MGVYFVEYYVADTDIDSWLICKLDLNKSSDEITGDFFDALSHDNGEEDNFIIKKIIKLD